MLRRLHLLLALVILPPVVWADELPQRITIATWNLEWFFDHYAGDNAADVPKEQSPPTREQWQWKLDVTAQAIVRMRPTILCLQEVESKSTVAKLVKKLRDEHRLEYHIAFVEGNDVFTEQDVAVLALSGLVEYGRKEQTREMFQSRQYYELSKHLFCRFQWGEGEQQVRLTLLNFHARAQQDQPDIRIRQARLAHYWLSEQLLAGENVVLAGDTNTEYPFERTAPESDIHMLRGWHTKTTADDLFDCHQLLKPEDRSTHLTRQQFDRIFVSNSLVKPTAGRKRLVLKSVKNYRDLNTRGKQPDQDHWKYYDIDPKERDISDHFPIMAEFAAE